MALFFTITNRFWIGKIQRLVTPLVCLGDGHDGVWKLFTEIGGSSTRLEILDWYHLRENLLHCWWFSQATISLQKTYSGLVR